MPKTILPCCLFPTTFVIVDDDETFLNSLELSLCVAGITVQAFVEPKNALAFINSQQTLDLDDYYTTRVDISDNHSVYDTQADLSAILKQLHNTERTKRLSVVISDYHMPQINGLQLCTEIKSPSLKKVLLTSVASDYMAVSAFNDGTIDQFIEKGQKAL